MSTFSSVTDKRIIVEALVNGRGAYFLIDTGASVGLIDKDKKDVYHLLKGKRFNGSLVSASGKIGKTYMCNTYPTLDGRPITQFLLADIDSIKDSIKETTGFEILGIIGLPQMQVLGMKIDTDNNTITI